MGHKRRVFIPAGPPAPGAPQGHCACGRPAWHRTGSNWICPRCLAWDARRGGPQTRTDRHPWAKYTETYRVL